ncbi:MAG: hypothetical protein HYX56_00415 [Chloroflexi bacterium]|nr:hypothetical protein [Chloroflexota bacterium]
MSVLGGWVAAVGAAALISPAVAGIVTSRGPVPSDLALAVPVLVGLMISFLIGGYVAGRMAGYHTSWHGMMTAFVGLFIALVVLLLAGLNVIPGVSQFDPRTLGDTLTLGAILGFLATIFAGWLGGVLAPDHLVAVTPVVESEVKVVTGEPVRPSPSYRLLPAVGQKGGQPVNEAPKDEVRESRIE